MLGKQNNKVINIFGIFGYKVASNTHQGRSLACSLGGIPFFMHPN
jgi:hypothetical protein